MGIKVDPCEAPVGEHQVSHHLCDYTGMRGGGWGKYPIYVPHLVHTQHSMVGICPGRESPLAILSTFPLSNLVS